MTYLNTNFTFALAATFILGLLVGWFMWGRLKKQIVSLEKDWRNRFIILDDDYQSMTRELNEVELVLKDRIEHINTINEEKNDLAIRLNAATNLNSNTGNEIEELKSQLEKSNAHNHIINKQLDNKKTELEAFNNTPNEIKELKTLLGQATQRYNNNGLELKNKSEALDILQSQMESTNKLTVALKSELDDLRTKLLNRDKDYENQSLSLANLQDDLNNNQSMLLDAQTKLDSHSSNQTKHNIQLKERDEKILVLENQLKHVSQQFKDTQAQLIESKKLIPSLDDEINTLHERIPSLESSLKQRDSSIAALENEVNRLANEFPPLHDEIETHKKLADESKQELQALQQKIPSLNSTIAARDAHIRELEVFMKEAQQAILKPGHAADIKNGNGNGNGNHKTSHENMVAKANVVNINGSSKPNNNVTAHNNNEASKTNLATNLNGKTKNNGSVKPSPTNHKAAAKATKPKIKPYGLKKPTRKPDDLKLITGIGETLEKTLHKCGIFYFEQIASFNLKDVNTVDQLLNFRGRIDRDDWIKQARKLLRESKNLSKNKKNVASKKTTQGRIPKRKAKMKPLGMKRPNGELDDLQLINGVGPTLEKKLHRLGIYHFEQIAHLTAEDIALIDSKLKTYKGRVKRDKWPMQARKLHKEFYAPL